MAGAAQLEILATRYFLFFPERFYSSLAGAEDSAVIGSAWRDSTRSSAESNESRSRSRCSPGGLGCDPWERLIELIFAEAMCWAPVSDFLSDPDSSGRVPRRLLLPTYDLAIIGSGPGGYVAAIRAAQWGLKTLVIEKDGFLGGTCLHVGCIPTKVLLHHAEIYDTFKNAKEFGIEVSDFKLNWPAVLARKDKIVNKHAKGIEFLFRKNKVETMQGWGRWAGPGRVSRRKRRQDHRSRSHAHHVRHRLGGALAAGRGVRRQGDSRQQRNSEAAGGAEDAGDRGRRRGGRGVRLDLPFASARRSRMLEMLPRIVPLEDEEISAELEKSFRKRGIQIFTEAKVESVTERRRGRHGDLPRQGRRRRRRSPPSTC